jgi:hypothetical protein
MAEGPLVSVQHRLSAARTLASRARNSCAAAQHLTATLPPNHRPRVPSRPTLSLRRSSWKRPFDHFSTSPNAVVRFASASSPSSAPRWWAPPFAASLFDSPWLQHPPSYAGTSGGAQNCHPAAALPTPTPVTGESLTPRTLVQSPPLAAMPHPSGHFPSVPEAREASYPVNPPRRRWARSRSRRPVASWAPRRRVGARRVCVEVLVLDVDLPVHLGRQRPRGNPTVPRAPCAPARCERDLRVGSVSRLGRVRPGSVSEWASMAGRRMARSSGAVRPWAASGPRGWIYLNFIFKFILVFHNAEIFQKW